MKGAEDVHAFDTNPVYAVLHESIYCNGGGPSDWSAEKALTERRGGGAFDAFDAAGALAASSDTPVFFTGEMVFPFMFDDIAALQPLKPAVGDFRLFLRSHFVYAVHTVQTHTDTHTSACARYYHAAENQQLSDKISLCFHRRDTVYAPDRCRAVKAILRLDARLR